MHPFPRMTRQAAVLWRAGAGLPRPAAAAPAGCRGRSSRAGGAGGKAMRPVDFRSGCFVIVERARRTAAQGVIARRVRGGAHPDGAGAAPAPGCDLRQAVEGTATTAKCRHRVTEWLQLQVETFLRATGNELDRAAVLRGGANLAGDDIFVSDCDYTIYHAAALGRPFWTGPGGFLSQLR